MRLLVSGGGGGGGGRRVEGSLGERVSAGLGGHSTRDDRGWEDDVTTIAVVIVVVVIVVAAGVCDESRVEVVTGRGESGRRREGVGLGTCRHHSSCCPSIPLVVVNESLFLLLLVA